MQYEGIKIEGWGREIFWHKLTCMLVSASFSMLIYFGILRSKWINVYTRFVLLHRQVKIEHSEAAIRHPSWVWLIIDKVWWVVKPMGIRTICSPPRTWEGYAPQTLKRTICGSLWSHVLEWSRSCSIDSHLGVWSALTVGSCLMQE